MLKLSDLVIDDELKDLLPRGSDDERDKLLANIRADGRITSPLIVWLNHAIIVDGHTRFDIWQNELGSAEEFEPEIIEKAFESRDHVEAWMIRHQDGQRNWNTSQRAMMAVRLTKLKIGDNQHSKNGEGLQNCRPSIEEAAKEENVSARSVSDAKKVTEEGSATLSKAVKDGKVKVSDAAKITKLPKSKQDAAVAKVAAGKATTVAKAAGMDPQEERNRQILKGGGRLRPEREPGDESENDPQTFKLQRSKTIKTAESLLRAFDDLQGMKSRKGIHANAIKAVKELITTAKEW